MTNIYLDESGDLGFDLSKKGTSKHFIITILFIPNARKVQKLVIKVHKTLRKSHKRKFGILHAFKESPSTRHRMLKLLASNEVTIMTICLNKKSVTTKTKIDQYTLYNYIVNTLLNRINSKKLIPLDNKVILTASKKDTNKFLSYNFKNYLEGSESSHSIDLEVNIRTIFEEKCLQAVDFASWAIYRKYEHSDLT